MELKAETRHGKGLLHEFQSHLYGIESREKRPLFDEHGKFQSHLYGIERVVMQFYMHRKLVSIAPLWNWKYRDLDVFELLNSFNRTFMELKGAPRPGVTLSSCRFQSHLYGIESDAVCAHRQGGGVSIAPLWNWKTWSLETSTTARRFQSHLYGIESTHRLRSNK